MQISASLARSTLGSGATEGLRAGWEPPGRAGPRGVRAPGSGIGPRTGRGRAAARRDLGAVRAPRRAGGAELPPTVLIWGLRGCSMSEWREQPC